MSRFHPRNMKTGYLLKRFVPYYKNYWPIVVLDLVCASLTTVCELALPEIAKKITDVATNDIASLTVQWILRLAAFYMALRLMGVAAQYFMTYTGHVMGTRMETDMRRDLFHHLQELPFGYYDETKVGQIMSRITNDLFEVTEFAHHCPEEYFIAGIKIVASFIILSRTDFTLTLIIFLLIPIMVICLSFSRASMKNASRKRRVQIGELNAQVEDSLLGVRVVKSFANEPVEEEKFKEGNEKFLDIQSKYYRYFARFKGIESFFNGLMYILVVAFGAWFILKGRIEAADLVAYLLYVQMLLTAIRRVVDNVEKFQQGMTGIERFIEIMDAPASIANAPDAVELPPVRGDIRFEDVTFRYSETHRDVLAHLNLHVAAGDNVAMVGPSGGGKTTICNLIPRFYEITGGRITVDGYNIQDVTLESLRNQIGIVQQDVYLFAGTVRDNIAYGKPGATEEEIIEAAKKADAHEFIMNLPHGYDSYVGERGVKLSGGQKQRISIARVFLKNPPILLLDEATSALDNESEYQVQQSLERLAKGRTTFTIAHRLTTVHNAKTILVLTREGIQEQGTHEELMARNGLYAKMYQMYQR